MAQSIHNAPQRYEAGARAGTAAAPQDVLPHAEPALLQQLALANLGSQDLGPLLDYFVYGAAFRSELRSDVRSSETPDGEQAALETAAEDGEQAQQDADVGPVGKTTQGVHQAGKTREAAAAAPRAELDFWSEVVQLQTELAGSGVLNPSQALHSAIAWVAVLTTLPEPLRRPAASQPTALGVQPAHSSGQAPRSLAQRTELTRWVSDLRADLSHHATQALIDAWQQRGSALQAAEGARG